MDKQCLANGKRHQEKKVNGLRQLSTSVRKSRIPSRARPQALAGMAITWLADLVRATGLPASHLGVGSEGSGHG